MFIFNMYEILKNRKQVNDVSPKTKISSTKNHIIINATINGGRILKIKGEGASKM